MPVQYEITLIPVSDLKSGDMVDLEGDTFADPQHTHVMLEAEYVTVDEIDCETPNCIAVYFDGFDCVGFPHNHLVRVRRNARGL